MRIVLELLLVAPLLVLSNFSVAIVAVLIAVKCGHASTVGPKEVVDVA